jgi:acetoacetate decarboxylase
MSNEKFVVHKNAPGPPRQHVEKADNSGKVNTDPQFIADRQAIINTITAYSYLIDEGRWNDWYSLFSDDIEFATTVPELGTVTVHGKKAFVAMAEERYVKPGKTSTAVRRHTQGNVHVVDQTPTTAKVRTYMLISNVPAGDKLQLLTTGTYNANLEKRNGRWVITRWYIECDAPLAPNKMPEGFSESELKWIGDPSIQLPDAVPGPTQGLVTLKDRQSVMPKAGPLYKLAPVSTWEKCDIVLIDYLTDAKSAAAFLPEQLTTFPIAELPGYSAVKLLWAHYRDSSVGPYDEFLISIPCLYKGELYLYVPLIYVTTDTAMASGREVGGWPKKIADISMEQFGNEWHVSMSRGGERLLSASMKSGRKLFSTPLPADKPVNLPYPFNLTLPLPAPTGRPLANFPFPTMALKIIPGVGSDNPSPELAQLIGAQWRLSGNVYGGSDATVACYPSDADPFYKLPILKVLGSMYVYGDMTLALKEIKVVEDLLKAQPESLRKKVGRVA